MSVNSYLTLLASDLVLKGFEKDNITSSISTLKTRLSNYFSSNIVDQFKFGSYTRDTILPRKADASSDVDYMIVFNTSSETYQPQTYLNQLRKFAEYYYSSSEIGQDNPTIVLELNHIRFELVPAIYNYQYQIPSRASSWSKWMVTDPNGFNEQLVKANTAHGSRIKPCARLVKYWNSLNGSCYGSFDLEKYIVGLSYWNCNDQKDYFYSFWNSFSCTYDTAQYIKDKVQRAKDKVALAIYYQKQGNESAAEYEIQKLLPTIS